MPIEYFKDVGNYVSGLTSKFIDFLSEMGYVTPSLTSKIVSLLIIIGAIYVIVHFVTAMKKPLKWIILGLLGLLGLSILSTFIP